MNEKKWNEISEDELCHRQLLQDTWKIKPSRKAVAMLEKKLMEVLRSLGVEVDKDEETIRWQMGILNIMINSISEDQLPNAAGIYVSAIYKGELQPYAYISCVKQKRKGEFLFEVVYWNKERMDEIVAYWNK